MMIIKLTGLIHQNTSISAPYFPQNNSILSRYKLRKIVLIKKPKSFCSALQIHAVLSQKQQHLKSKQGSGRTSPK